MFSLYSFSWNPNSRIILKQIPDSMAFHLCVYFSMYFKRRDSFQIHNVISAIMLWTYLNILPSCLSFVFLLLFFFRFDGFKSKWGGCFDISLDLLLYRFLLFLSFSISCNYSWKNQGVCSMESPTVWICWLNSPIAYHVHLFLVFLIYWWFLFHSKLSVPNLSVGIDEKTLNLVTPSLCCEVECVSPLLCLMSYDGDRTSVMTRSINKVIFWGHLAGSDRKACESWPQGYELEAHVGCRDYLNKYFLKISDNLKQLLEFVKMNAFYF